MTQPGSRPRIPALIAVTLSLLAAGPAFAQVDETCVVSVLNRSVRVKPDGVWVLPNVPANMGRVRARATCVENGVTRSGESALFVVPADGVVDVPEIAFDAPQTIPARLELLAPSGDTLTGAGQTLQLQARATYTDGSIADVTAAASGVTYVVTNPGIATVSDSGVVTAVTSGTVLVTALHEGANAIRRVRVVASGDTDGDGIPDDLELANGLDPNDPVDALEDVDRDGLTNRDELQRGTDLRDADSDDDSLPDGREVELGTDPLVFDTDGDGIGDGLELATGSDPLDPASYNLAQALLSTEVEPTSAALVVNTVVGEASRQLRVTGRLLDGRTLDLTSTSRGTSYSSSDLLVVNFGGDDGRIFAGNEGTATVTVSNAGFSAQVSVTVSSFTPQVLASLPIPGALRVAVSGNHAYVAAGANGLVVVDVTDRSNPQVAATVDTPGTASAVAVSGSHVVVADGSGGLRIFDVTNPAFPSQASVLAVPGSATRVAIQAGRAYVGAGTNLHVVDVTNPAAPALLTSLAAGASVGGVGVDGELAVLAVGTTGIRVVDVSATPPLLLGTLDTDEARDVVVEGSVAYVADWTGSLKTVSLAEPTAPALLGSTPQATGGILLSLAKQRSFAFGADAFFVNGVPLVDVTDPATPLPRARLDFPGAAVGTGIDADDSYLYLVTGDSRLNIGQYLQIDDQGGVPPTIALTAPADGAELVAGRPVVLRATANDDVAVAEVTFLVDGAPVFRDTGKPFEFSYAVPPSATALTFSAAARDYGANEAISEPVNVTVVPDPPPTVEIVTPVEGSTVTGGSFIALQAAPADNSAVARVIFAVNDVAVGVATAAPWAVSYQVPNDLTTLRIRARAVDDVGQTAEAVRDVAVQISATPRRPEPARIAALFPAGGLSQVVGFADAVDGGVDLEIGHAATAAIVTATALADGSFSAQIAADPGDSLSLVAIGPTGERSDPAWVVVRSSQSDPASGIPTSGLQLWLRADAGVSLAGDEVASWASQAGNGNAAAPSAATRPRLALHEDLGYPLVRFDGADDEVRFPAALNGVIRTVFWVVRESDQATAANRSLLGHGTWRDFEGGSGAPGTIWRGDCCAAASVTGGQTWLNGVPIEGRTTPRPNQMSVVSLVTLGGMSADRFGSGTSQTPWWGDLAELVIYDRALPAEERAAVEAYLQVKYRVGPVVHAPIASPNGGVFTGSASVSLETRTPGAEIRYTLDGSEPTETSAAYAGPIAISETTTLKARAFIAGGLTSDTTTAGFTSDADSHPGKLAGLRLWWRADAGVPTGHGDLWQDQSGLGNHGAQPLGAAVPTLVRDAVNGLPAMRFDGSADHVRFPAQLNGVIRTVFWVVRESADATAAYRGLLGHPNYRDFEGGNGAPGAIWRGDCCAAASVTGGQTWLNGLPVEGRTTPRPNQMSVVSLVTLSGTSADRFGSGTGQSPWWGDLAELVIYDRALTPEERKSVEAYLLDKYEVGTGTPQAPIVSPNGGVFTGGSSLVSLQVTTPGAVLRYTLDGSEPGPGSPVYDEPFEITGTTTVKVKAFLDGEAGPTTTVGFTSDADAHPGKLAGLKLWWRADAGVPTGHGDLWRDQSGSNNHGSQASGAAVATLVQDAAGGLPAMRFDGNADNVRFTSEMFGTIRTVFWVVREGEDATAAYRGLLGHQTYVDFEGGTGAPGTIWRADCCAAASVTGGQTWLNGLPVEGRTTPRPNEMSVVSLVTLSGMSADRFGAGAGQSPWWGDLAELVIYDRALTPEERKSVEAYLLGKYEVGPVVQAPLASPAGGVVTQPIDVTLESGTRGAEIRYTLDGSEPTNGSTLYTGPISIGSTTSLKAKAFAGLQASETTTAGFTSDADDHPGKLTGLTLWWRADAGVPTGHGDLWRDHSAAGNHGSQPFGAAVPTLVQDVVNGLPAMRFDGNADHVRLPAQMNGAVRTVFWVLRETAGATSGNRSLLGHTNYRDFEGGIGAPGTIWRSDCCVSSAVTGGQTFLNGLPIDGRVTPRPTSMALVSLVTTAGMSTDRFGIGNAQSPWWGDLAELLIYDRALSPAERIQVEDYLNAKYGLFIR